MYSSSLFINSSPVFFGGQIFFHLQWEGNRHKSSKSVACSRFFHSEWQNWNMPRNSGKPGTCPLPNRLCTFFLWALPGPPNEHVLIRILKKAAPWEKILKMQPNVNSQRKRVLTRHHPINWSISQLNTAELLLQWKTPLLKVFQKLQVIFCFQEGF